MIVFDFGSELYIWNGKQTTKEQRKIGVKLAQVIWERGYDYTEYDVNPVCPGDKTTTAMKAEERPDWSLFCKVRKKKLINCIIFRCIYPITIKTDVMKKKNLIFFRCDQFIN